MSKTTHIKRLNIILALVVIVLNIYFVRVSTGIIAEEGGTWGLGLPVLAISLPMNLLLIPALLTIKKNWSGNRGLLVLNTFAALWGVFWFYQFITVPYLD